MREGRFERIKQLRRGKLAGDGRLTQRGPEAGMEPSKRQLIDKLLELRAELEQLMRAQPACRLALLRLSDAVDRVLLVLPAFEIAAAGGADTAAGFAVGHAGGLSQDALEEAHAELAQAFANSKARLDAGAPFPAMLAAYDAAGAGLAALASRSVTRTRSADASRPAPACRTALPDAEQLSEAAPPTCGSGSVALPEPLQMGAAAPRTAALGTTFVASFIAYAPSDAEAARASLAADGLDRRVVAGGSSNVRRGTRFVVQLSGRALKIEGKDRFEQAFVWDGTPVKLPFEVAVPEGAMPGTTVLKYDVMLDGLVLARLRLELELQLHAAPAPLQQKLGGTLARTAFASYSSKDRARVLDRVAAVRIAADIDVFLDCRDLNPGKPWQPRLEQEIDRRDTFMLFWSEAAAASTWVTWEWERALQRKGLEHMQIHPLENGVKPPRALAALHMADSAMSDRAATLSAKT